MKRTFSCLRIALLLICFCTSAGRGLDLSAQVQGAEDTTNVFTAEPIEIRSQSLSKLSSVSIDLIDFERRPAVFNDPARLIALQPGISQTNDQANHLVVRGNSPSKNLWLINGLAIVNPNHTANAGTINDRPALSGGGVNALSPQLLYNSRFYAGGLPAKYGSAPGGAFAVELRPGAIDDRRLRAMASFIGIDLTAENRLQPENPYSWSYLATYRYSFTGLLADLGADFGGEEIRFQDAGLHLHKWTKSGGAISLFGLYGNSSNVFRGPEEEADRMEEKDRLNIDFDSDIVIATGRWQQPLGRSDRLLSLGLAYSENTPGREQSGINDSTLDFGEFLRHRRFNARADLNWNAHFSFGLAYLSDEWLQERIFNGQFEDSLRSRDGTETDRLSAYATYENSIGRLRYSVGAEFGHYGEQANEPFFVGPRLLIALNTGTGEFLFNVESVSQLAVEAQRFQVFGDATQPVMNHRSELGYRRVGTDRANWSLLVFGQYTPEEYAYVSTNNFLVGDNNLLEAPPLWSDPFVVVTSSRRYGLEAGWNNSPDINDWRLSANGSLFRAETEQLDGSWAQDRWSYGWTAQLGLGRDWLKTNRNGRERTLGLSLAVIGRGGERLPLIRVNDTFCPEGCLDYSQGGFSEQVAPYFRPDLRLYRQVKGEKSTTTLALDVQNVAGIENEAYRDFDSVTGRIETRYQLGFIPVLSYRVEWQ